MTNTPDNNSRKSFVDYLNNRYNSDNLEKVVLYVTKLINANILDISKYDYDPYGASVNVLTSEHRDEPNCILKKIHFNIPEIYHVHLDKSHITIHTYFDVGENIDVTSFRADIDISTCGNITPMEAINYLLSFFEGDIVNIEYIVRGYTRLEDGTKIYCDEVLNPIYYSIQPKILTKYLYEVSWYDRKRTICMMKNDYTDYLKRHITTTKVINEINAVYCKLK